MSIINRLAINDEENKIALFIDEVATIDKHNRPELVNFCREHNFIPIFAAPDPVPGFSKYYYITPNPNQKLIVTERHALHARSKEQVRKARKHDEEGFFAEAALQIEVN